MNDTIELFPGVQFRKDMTKPLGNQWMFLHEGYWLIAKLAYADDITLDHVAKLTKERAALLAVIADPELVFANMKAGRIAKISLRSAIDLHGEVINGDDAQQLEIARLRAELDELRPNAKRYSWMRDCPWPGHMQAVGITAHGDDANWLAGAEADRAIDVAMAPSSEDIPDFSPGNGNKARRRASAAGIDMDASLKTGGIIAAPPRRPWKEIVEPVAEADRKCHEPDCWNCEGTGRDPSGSLCVLGGGFPF